MKEGLSSFEIPLNGKLKTDVDPVLLDPGDFQTLENLRYRSRGITGVTGMTKTNGSVLNYTSVDSGFHFRKNQPEESHIIAQVTSGVNSKLVKATAPTIPSVGSDTTYSDFQTLANNNPVSFSPAPDGSMIAFNGDTNYLWSGNEYRTAQFINYDPLGTFWYNYTEQVTNAKNDSLNRATLKRVSAGIDSCTKALWHFDNVYTDTVGSHTFAAAGGGCVFGTGKFSQALGISGGAGYIWTADHADFNLSGGVYTIDAQVNLTAASTLYYQRTTADADSYRIEVDASGYVVVTVKKTASSDYTATSTSAIGFSDFRHIMVSQDATYLYIYIDGILVFKDAAPTTIQDYSSYVYVGYDGVTALFAGKIDELRVSNGVCRATTGFTPPIAAYGTGYETHAYVAATREIQGVKFYVQTANTSTGTCSAFYWAGSGEVSVGTVTDGTSSDGKTLAATGSVTFDSTAFTPVPRVIRESMAYFYHFVFSSIDDDVVIYYVTVDAPIQSIKDIWDGTARTAASVFKYVTSYDDNTTNVYNNEYVSATVSTFMQIGGMTSANSLYLGFQEKTMGIHFILPDDSCQNTVANTIIAVYYWDGDSWVSVGSITDGTSVGGVSMAQSGTVIWNKIGAGDTKTTVTNTYELYYYKIMFSTTLSANVRVDYVYGIPAPVDLLTFNFGVLWQNRLWICDEVDKNRNMAMSMAEGTVCVANGNGSSKLYFGDSEKLVAGSTIFSRFGGTVYDNLILFKQSSVFLVDGYDDSTFRLYNVSDTIGCVAPKTLVKCDVSFEVAPGLTKHVLIWESAGGIQMFDGNSISNISADIDDMFRLESSTYIGSDPSDFSAFFDQVKGEYHWLTQTREMVFDLIKKKWFEIDRGTGKHLNCGINIMASNGVQYVYGGTNDGYIERLEYGNTFDENDIVYTFRISDLPISKSTMYSSEIRHLKLIGISTTGNVAMTHYADGCTTGTSVTAISQVKAGYRFYQVNRSVSFYGVFHSLQCVVTSNGVAVGFDPISLSGLYRLVREDIL